MKKIKTKYNRSVHQLYFLLQWLLQVSTVKIHHWTKIKTQNQNLFISSIFQCSVSFAVNILNDCNAQKNGLKFYSLSPNIQSVIKFLPEIRGRSLSKSATIWPSDQHYFRMLFFQGPAPFLNQFFNLFIHFST